MRTDGLLLVVVQCERIEAAAAASVVAMQAGTATPRRSLVNLAPIAAVAFVVVTAMLYLVFRRRLQIAPEARQRVMELDAPLN